MNAVVVRSSRRTDRPAIDRILTESWGEPRAAAHDRLYDLTTLPALVATRAVDPPDRAAATPDAGATPDAAAAPDAAAGERIVGVLTFDIQGDAIEVVSIDASPQWSGIGSTLLAAATDFGIAERLARLWLVTTNDNVDALRFYQRRGLRILAVHLDAVARSRMLKPSIPMIGAYGIPIRDEIVLGRDLPRAHANDH